jgi:alpha-amylase
MLADDYGKPVLYSGYAFSANDAGPVQDSSGRVADAECAAAPTPEDEVADGGWVCPHRWPGVAEMVGWRSRVGDAAVTEPWHRAGGYAFTRGAGFFAANADDDPLAEAVPSGMVGGTYCDVVTGGVADGRCAGTSVDVSSDGTVTVQLDAWQAIAIDAGSRID